MAASPVPDETRGERVVAVATSGGRDSLALLHCAVRAGAPLGLKIVALHVHHGLQPQADEWQALVRRRALRWGAGFRATRLCGSPAAGDSVEAWARRERYRALSEMARAEGCVQVWLAHHRSDQAETFVLQALRGAGPAGLAAMPRSVWRDGLEWVRPWLHQPRSAIDAYVARHRLRAVDDPSNEQPRWARSRLRVAVWPALREAFPQAESALGEAAQRCWEAQQVLDEVGWQDLEALRAAAVQHGHPDQLWLPAWQALPPGRRRLALRGWLAAVLPVAPAQSLLSRLSSEWDQRVVSTWPAPGGTVRRYRHFLAYTPARLADPADPADPARPAGGPGGGGAAAGLSAPDAPGATGRDGRDGPPAAVGLTFPAPGRWPVPGWTGWLEVEPADGQGLAPGLLRQVEARARGGGERLALQPNATPRPLKKQFQALGVPAWQREGPLLWDRQGRLLFVPGLGVDARVWAPPGELQWRLRWCPGR